MSTHPDSASHSLPDRPSIEHLKNQAKDLLRAGGATSLTAAQREIARQYGFASWPKLNAHVESVTEIGQLKDAIDANDLARVVALMTRRPALHQAPLGYGKNGPLTWAAECRGVACSPERLAIARWMLENGSDVHQGGDGPLMRAALSDERIPMLELLVEHGADVNARWGGDYPIICGPCECLAPESLQWLISHGADMNVVSGSYGTCVEMLISTYSRDPQGKHACLKVFAEAGFSLPNTAPLAIHRGRIDLLEECLARDPSLLARRFAESEIYPAELGIRPGRGLHGTPLDGTTLLHMAVEFQEAEIVEWLLTRGADVNARAAVDSDGFGGHTPLFHTTVSLPPRRDTLARVLLAHGADPHLRTTLRKQLVDMGDPEKERMYEFHNVTAVEYTRQFQEPRMINVAAIAAIEEFVRP
ncbi:MAG: ankyrin repeat domain-containing protein [Pirellulales bacterium]